MKPTPCQQLGKAIRETRERKSISVESLAALCRTGTLKIKTIEAGETDPRLSDLVEICKALKIWIAISPAGEPVFSEGVFRRGKEI